MKQEAAKPRKKKEIELFVARSGPHKGKPECEAAFATKAEAVEFLTCLHGLDVDEARKLGREMTMALNRKWHGAEGCGIEVEAMSPAKAKQALSGELYAPKAAADLPTPRAISMKTKLSFKIKVRKPATRKRKKKATVVPPARAKKAESAAVRQVTAKPTEVPGATKTEPSKKIVATVEKAPEREAKPKIDKKKVVTETKPIPSPKGKATVERKETQKAASPSAAPQRSKVETVATKRGRPNKTQETPTDVASGKRRAKAAEPIQPSLLFDEPVKPTRAKGKAEPKAVVELPLQPSPKGKAKQERVATKPTEKPPARSKVR